MKQYNNQEQVLQELCRQQIMMEKHYNRFAAVCRGIPLRNSVLELLQDEHLLHGELLTGLLERGLIKYDIATPRETEQVKRELKQKGIG